MNPVFSYPWAIIVAAVFVALTVFAYRRFTRAVPRGVAVALWCLRGFAVLLVLALIFRPEFSYSRAESRQPILVFLTDASKSMSIEDEEIAGGGRTSRAKAVVDALGKNSAAIQRLQGIYRVEMLQFGERLRPAQGFAVEPTDEVTRLTDALLELNKWPLEGPIAAVVLFSDGADNLLVEAEPREAARALGRRDAPIFAVPFGSDEASAAIRDISARNLSSPRRTFAGNTVIVKAVFGCLGLKGRTVEFSLDVDGKEVETKSVKVAEARRLEEIRFALTLAQAGFSKITVRARPIEGELSATNNSLSTFVRVDKGQVRVLYLEGQVRSESKFIALALAEAEQFDLQRITLLKSPADGGGQLPASPSEWARYDCFIIGDVPSRYFSTEQLKLIAGLVAEEGKGLVMIGGLRSFGAGGYARTPIADLLPVHIRDGDGQTGGEVIFVPTEAGLGDFVLNLTDDADANRKAWEAMPALLGANEVGDAKPAAEVLARSKEGRVLLARQNYGRGRTAALAVDTTWRWRLKGLEQPPGAYHKRFWRQLVLWLARRDVEQDVGIWVTTSSPCYDLTALRSSAAGGVGFGAGVFDGEGRPIAGAEVEATLKLPDGTSRPVALRRTAEGRYAGAVGPAVVEKTGDYTVALEVRKAGKVVGTAECKFVVWRSDLEMSQPLANRGLLRDIGAASGGEVIKPGEIEALFERLISQPLKTFGPVRRTLRLWDVPYVLALLLAALSAEWVLRRRSRLV